MKKNNFPNISELKKQYTSVCDVAERFKNELCHELIKLIDDNGLKLGFPIQKRIKTWSSIKDKLLDQNLKLKSIKQLQDLIGLRTVFLYKRDLKLIENIIQKTFVVKKRYDTSDRLAENQFGYSSIHFVIQFPKEWLKVPSLSEFGGFSAEIQIRTLAQHIWSEVSHELQYKTKGDVPLNLIRPIYRTSALLETVDLEFERLLQEREEYRKQIDKKIDQELNVDSIEQILDSILPSENKDFFEEYAQLHKEILKKGIKTTDQLRNFVKGNIEWAIEDDKNRVASKIEESREAGMPTCPPDDWERVRKGYFFTHAGLLRRMLKKDFGK